MWLNKKLELAIQLAFWVLLIVVFTSLINQVLPIWLAFAVAIKTLIILALIAYLNAWWLLPTFFKAGHFHWYFLGLLIVLFAGTYLNVVSMELIFPGLFPEDPPPIPALGEDGQYRSITPRPIFKGLPLFFLSITALFISTVYKLTKTFLEKDQRSSLLEREKIQHELNFLRSQINPHFLFNALNNLHATVQLYPQKAGEYILKLGDMLRYVLEDCKKEQVSLADEIAYIKNYIYFQELKDAEFQNIHFEYDGGDTNAYFLEPMLFIPLVENAFIHSYSDQTEERFIQLKLQLTKDGLNFEIANNLPSVAKKGSGLGLANIKRRLELLYPDQFQLEYGEKAGMYVASLKLKNK